MKLLRVTETAIVFQAEVDDDGVCIATSKMFFTARQLATLVDRTILWEPLGDQKETRLIFNKVITVEEAKLIMDTVEETNRKPEASVVPN